MPTNKTQKLLADENISLIEIYLDLQILFGKKYGPNTVLLIEAGSFFEIYGVNNTKEQIGKPKEISEILNDKKFLYLRKTL